MLLAVSLACLAPQTRLNEPMPMPVVGAVQGIGFAPVGPRLVYVADQDQPGELRLYSAKLDASGDPLQLSPGTSTVARSLQVRSDGAVVAFLTEPGHELFVAPLDGSSPALQLTGSIPMEDSDVFPLAFSPDGAWVVYREEPFPIGPASLVSVRADGSGVPLVLDTSPTSQVQSFALDATSTRVVYQLESKLFSVPIDGSLPPVQLGPLGAGQGVSSFQLTDDGSRVVFRAGIGTTHLYAGPLDGATPAVLVSATGGSSELPPSPQAYALTPGGTHVLFLADLALDGQYQLYRAPLDASQAPVRLNHALAANAEVIQFHLSPDGRRIAYIESVAGSFEGLYLTNARGGLAPVRLNRPADEPILGPPPTFTPDSTRLVYKLFENGGPGRLFMVDVARIASHTPRRHRRPDLPLTPTQSVSGFVLSSTGRFVLYQTTSGSFSVPVSGGTPLDVTPEVAPGGSVGPTIVGPGDRGYLFARLDALAGQSLFSLPLGTGELDGPLNGPLALGPATGHVNTYAVTPADEVLYVANRMQGGAHELFRVPADGSAAPARLSGTMGPGGSLGGSSQPPGILALSADGERFAYIADQELNQRNDLYAGPVDGSSPAVAVAVPSVGVGGTIEPGMLFTPDGDRLVFRGRFAAFSRLELFSAPSDASTVPVRLSAAPPSGTVTVEADFALTGDGSRVLYRSDEASLGKLELFGAPTDGSAVRQRLSASAASTRDVTGFRLGADSTTVVYLADRDVDERFELYHVSATGGTVTPLDPPFLAGTDVTQFELTPDAARVLYRADRDLDEQHELYSVPSTGGTSVRLNGALVSGGDVGFAGVFPGITLTPDGRRVVFVVDATTDEAFELHVAPVDGSAPALLVSGTLQVDAFPWPFAPTPDSRQVVFLAHEPAGPVSAYLAPLDASVPPRALPQPAGHVALSFQLDPAGVSALLVSRDPLDFATHTLQRVQLASGRAELLVQDSGSLFRLGFTASPRRGLFLADLQHAGSLELYSVRLPRIPLVR